MEDYCNVLDDIRNKISSNVADLDATQALHDTYDKLVEEIRDKLPNDAFAHGIVPYSYDIGQYIKTARTMSVKLKRDEVSRQESLDKGVRNWMNQINLLKVYLGCSTL